MTEPMMTGYNPATAGCTHPDCGSQDTVTIDGNYGRRCADHPPSFDRGRVVELLLHQAHGTALAYCRFGWVA